MIQRLEVRNFRMLRSNAVSLRPFHVLVGQNATGKSTLLGAIQLLADMMKPGEDGGVRGAVRRVARGGFFDLCFFRDEPISFAVELEVPGSDSEQRDLRYEIEIGVDRVEGLRILRENLLIPPENEGRSLHQQSLFSRDIPVVHETTPRGWRKVVSKTPEGRDYFRDERTEWNNMFRFGLDRSALGSLPEDPDRFPLSIAAKNTLRNGVQTLMLDAAEMRAPSPPDKGSRMEMDGSNLPHVARSLQERDPVLFRQWVETLQLAIEGLSDISVREKEEDRSLVLEATFAGQHEEPVPSWLLSDGTLRLMALTLLSYAAGEGEARVYLIEEPENGLHPLAIQIAYEALSDPPPNTQILCATHSPIFLAQTELEQALVFRRADEGYAIVRRGPELPELQKWSGNIHVSDLFVTGVLA